MVGCEEAKTEMCYSFEFDTICGKEFYEQALIIFLSFAARNDLNFKKRKGN